MTSQNLQGIFGVSDVLSEFDAIHWKTQDSTEQSILFYNFRNKSHEEVQNFKERIKSAKFKKCLVNFEFESDLDNIIHLSDTEIESIKVELLDIFYPVKDNLIFLGVTGTNGKTTTVDLIRQLCLQCGKNVLTIGTLGIIKNTEKQNDFGLTTPSFIDFRKAIYRHQDDIDIVAMELSSIALEQNRVGSTKFESIGWTNFTQDHLDYHKTMENYFDAKMLVFDVLKTGGAVFVPSSQEELLVKINKTHKGIIAKDVQSNQAFFKLKYNQENLSLAVSLVSSIVDTGHIKLDELTPPPGRANIIEHKKQIIVIDYAHTPDGIISITKNLKTSFQDKDLITIFGCGGDRDRTKRPLMAKAAQDYSEFVILTTDNPRFEDPQQILDDAKVGLRKNSEVIMERKKAIKNALNKYTEAVILIAGKGHEDYMDIKGVKHPYNDLDWVKEIIGD